MPLNIKPSPSQPSTINKEVSLCVKLLKIPLYVFPELSLKFQVSKTEAFSLLFLPDALISILAPDATVTPLLLAIVFIFTFLLLVLVENDKT